MVGFRDVLDALHGVATSHAAPALSASGPAVNVYALGQPGMSWPALFVDPLPEGEGSGHDHQADSDVLFVDVCVAIPALNDASALAAADALDVLRAVYSRELGGASSVTALRRVRRSRGVGLSVRQFEGPDGPYCHVARVRLRVEVLAPTF